MEYTNLKTELQAAIEQAEEPAIKSIETNSGFSPYIYTGENKIKRIIADSLEEAIEVAEEEIENMEEETVVLIFEDTITLNDGSFKAIVSQVYNNQEDDGYSFGRLYKVEDDKIKFLNKRVFLGNVRNCLIF